MKKRIAQLLESWSLRVSEESPEFKQNLYSTLMILLKDSDFATQLRAACALREITEDGNFDVSLFSPYLQDCLTLLAQLAEKSQATYTTKQILEILGRICNCFEDAVIFFMNVFSLLLFYHSFFQFHPHADFILQLLGTMWQKHSERTDIKMSIISTLSSIVRITKFQASHYSRFFIGVITSQLNPQNSDSLVLLKDILKLWIQIINSELFQYSVEWAELFRAFLASQTNWDHLMEYADLAFAYLAKDPSFIQVSFPHFTNFSCS